MRVSTSNQTLPLSYFALVFPTGIKADVRPLADRSPIIIICPTRCDTLVIHRFVPVPPFVIVSPFFFCPLPPVFIFIFFFPFLRSLFFRPFFPTLFFRFSLSLSLSLVATTINRLSTSLRASPTRGGSRMKESVRAFFFFSFLYVSTVSIRIPLSHPLPLFSRYAKNNARFSRRGVSFNRVEINWWVSSKRSKRRIEKFERGQYSLWIYSVVLK